MTATGQNIQDITDKDTLALLHHHNQVLDFILKLTPAQRRSFASIMTWPTSLIDKFRDNPDHLIVLHKSWDVVQDRQRFIDGYMSATTAPGYDPAVMLDAFSRGQLRSKRWLVDTIAQLSLKLGRTWVLCGWIGMLPYLLFENQKQLGIEYVRSFDKDARCASIAERLNGHATKDGWMFKASTLDVNQLHYSGFGYITAKSNGDAEQMIESPDTIINTSAEHLSSMSWFDAIPQGKLVIIQCNDLETVDEHVNTVSDEFELSMKYPLSSTVFLGRLNCNTYHRFMIIGYK